MPRPGLAAILRLSRAGPGVGALALACAIVAGAIGSALAQPPPGEKGPILTADPKLDEQTVIAPSRIPGAGNGLFAKVRIAKGAIIGELGGELIAFPDLDNPNPYLAGLPECPSIRLEPYKYLDSKEHGGNVSRANFAPRAINGKETGFQNARLERVCRLPYVIYTALRDIEPGEEILLSYGPHYDYNSFMYKPVVRDYFCGLAKVDCSKEYQFEH